MNANEVLAKLIDTIEVTGGVKKDRKGFTVPVADEDWIDLGAIYLDACKVVGKEPQYEEQDEDE